MLVQHNNFFDFFKSGIVAATIVMGAASSPFPSIAEEQKQPSVISLDYCADQFVLLLSDRKQILSVSNVSEDAFSFFRERAKGIPKNKGSIEEVIVLSPDVAVQTYNMAARMKEMTDRTDIHLATTQYGSDPDTVMKNVSQIGSLLNQDDRANEFNQSYSKRFEALQNASPRTETIAYITPGGVTAGAGTSVDDIIKLAGFRNYAAEQGFSGWVNIPLENLTLDPPDLFITSFFDRNPASQSQWSLSRHDFLHKMMTEKPTLDLPSSHMSCNGLFLVDAAELIRIGALEVVK